jgi:arabinogalactan oligomer/maltooligosaccharide transport system permease protein
MSREGKYTLSVGLQTFVGPHRAEWGLMTASSVVILLPAGILFFSTQKHLVAGLNSRRHKRLTGLRWADMGLEVG